MQCVSVTDCESLFDTRRSRPETYENKKQVHMFKAILWHVTVVFCHFVHIVDLEKPKTDSERRAYRHTFMIPCSRVMLPCRFALSHESFCIQIRSLLNEFNDDLNKLIGQVQQVLDCISKLLLDHCECGGVHSLEPRLPNLSQDEVALC